MFSFPECITWLAVGLTQSVAIVIINIITIVVFIKSRNLRKRGTYLVINLAAVDMLVGGPAAYVLFYGAGENCNLWQPSKHWAYFLMRYLLTLGSLINITIIAAERFYVTFWPFRHRLIKKSVYGFLIAFVWVTAGLLSFVELKINRQSNDDLYLWFSYCSICLLIICISSASIVIKVRCGAQPQRYGAASRERKLTMTLLIVTVVSLLLYLPDNLFHFLDYTTDIISSMSKVTSTRLHNTLRVFVYANSLVNPILYAIRMPEFRSAIRALFRRRPLQRQAAVFPLHDM